MHGEQAALDQVRLLRLAQPDRAVGLPHRQIEFLVGEDELKADFRIEIGEFMQALGQPAGPEPDGRGHPAARRRAGPSPRSAAS